MIKRAVVVELRRRVKYLEEINLAIWRAYQAELKRKEVCEVCRK